MEKTMLQSRLAEQLSMKFSVSGIGNVRELVSVRAIRAGYNPYVKSDSKDARVIPEKIKSMANAANVPSSPVFPRPREEDRVSIKNIRKENIAKPAGRAQNAPVRAAEKAVSARGIFSQKIINKRAPFPVSSMFTVLICAATLMFVVYSGVLINEATREISSLQSEISTMTQNDKQLELEIAQRNNLVDIADIAENQLGMVKVSEAEQKYINLGIGDSVETVENEDEKAMFGATLLSAAGETFGSLLEYLN